jgi:hypothetical protein
VFPFRLIKDGRQLGEFKQTMRFDVTHSLRRSIHGISSAEYAGWCATKDIRNVTDLLRIY